MKNYTAGALVAIASLLATTQASAATAVLSISGYVVSGVDIGGLFGKQGESLANKSLNALYNITYTNPQRPGPYSNVYYSSNIIEAPISTASLVISNASLLNRGNQFAIASMSDGAIDSFGYDQIFLSNQDYFETNEQWVVSRLTFSFSSATKNFVDGASFSNQIKFSPNDSENGMLYSYGYNKKTKTFFDQSIKLRASFLALNVPEPATWVMMLLGFSLIGGLMRRRPRNAMATYAS